MNSDVPEQHANPFKIWTNPIGSELDELPDVVRFTAVLDTSQVLVWDYGAACHTDVSALLLLHDSYDSPFFLKGSALRQSHGRFVMSQSHFLEAFKLSRLTRGERSILTTLLGQDWSWVNEFVEVTAWLETFRIRFRI